MEKKGFISEFKEFIMRGNVIDLAVGVIIGGAFQKIVTSLVNDIIMPVVTRITGGVSSTYTELWSIYHRSDSIYNYGICNFSACKIYESGSKSSKSGYKGRTGCYQNLSLL